MTLKLYNTLSRKKEVFKPIEKGKIRIYTCGPTLYSYAHIGNFRAYIAADLLRRYLEYRGFKIKQVMNLTDIDDKTIKGSRKAGISLQKFTSRYKKAFFEDIKTLNIEKVEIYPEATKHIPEMVELVKLLLKKGFAYKGNDNSIYFDISKFKDYGKLSHMKIKKLKAGARVKHDEYDKEDVADFVLWKAWDKNDGNVFWKTSLGKGRPGWHIECSAMSMKYMGKNFDIHGGGVDLIFPHHENEIAQSEAAGKRFVNYWVHNEHLLVEGRKMSKSLGNFHTLRDLLKKGYDPKAIRLLLLSTHYRQLLDFTFRGLATAKNTLEKLFEFMGNLKDVKESVSGKKIPSLIEKIKKDFEAALDDDLNIAIALSKLFDFIREINKLVFDKKISKKDAEKIYNLMLGFDGVLGLGLSEDIIKWHSIDEAKPELKKLILKREEYRKGKNWLEADKIRSSLKKQGIILEDQDEGPRWRKTKG